MEKKKVEIEWTINIDGHVVTLKNKTDAEIITKKLASLEEDIDYYYELYRSS